MKINHKVIFLLSLVTFLCACNKEVITNDSEISVELNKKYIQFDSGISTRGNLNTEEYLTDDFAVLGYQYRGTWEVADVMARPNVFYSDAAKTNLALPQVVTYNKGIFTYTPIQAWTGNMYSFFGYYPSSHKYIKLFDGPDSNNKLTIPEGVPYITYDITDNIDPRELIDVMTSGYIDTNIDSSPEVVMIMKHRLSALDVSARNYYIHEIKNEQGEVLQRYLVTIEITNLELTLNTDTKAKIYLDGTTTTVTSDPRQLKYQFVQPENPQTDIPWAHNTFDVKPNTSDDTALRSITATNDNSSTLLLLPTDLDGELIVEFKRKYYDGEKFIELPSRGSDDIVKKPLSDFNRTLLEGRRYTIEITFTSDAVSINISAAEEWEEIKDDLKHEFE